MQIVRIDTNAINQGAHAFNQYLGAALCSPSAAKTYARGLRRQTGVAALPGVITECIRRGLNTPEALVHAAARITLCKQSTVERLLAELTGHNRDRHLWSLWEGLYENLQDDDPEHSFPDFLIAA